MGADRLARLYQPQVEQFGVELKPLGDALVGTAHTAWADARVVVYLVGSSCLVTSHRVSVKRTMPFYEHGPVGLCVSTLSPDSLALCPVGQPARVRPAGNVAVFGGDAHAMERRLYAGQRHDATSVTFLPEWFDRLDDRDRRAARELIDEPGSACTEEVAHAIDRTVSFVTPLFGGGVRSKSTVARGMTAAALMTIAWFEERTRAERAAGTRAQARLAREAARYVALHIDRPLSLDDIARDLLTSRTRLCAAFRQETGESLGAYVRREKMDRACRLLGTQGTSVAEVARAVGYERLSSFTVAFERAMGSSPSAWRASCGDARGSGCD